MHKLRVGYTCNIRDNCRAEDERYSEWEPPETVEAVVTALVDAGCEISVIDVGPDIFHVLERRRSELDLIFNNAEGLEEGELREAIVPFCCEQLGIPHTGSTPKTFINALDKATAKRLVAYDGVTTPRFQVMRSVGDPLLPDLVFPLMVKPDREGTSIGITQASKVYDVDALRTQVERILDTYHQPALVEEFIDGTEYTIGLVGSYVLPILAVDLTKIPGQPFVRDAHVKEIDTAFSDSLSFDVAPDRYRAFAAAAVRAHAALEALDYNRMDFRARDGALYFLEANPIPGIGYAVYHRTIQTYHLDTIVVDRARRGEGIGTGLLASIRAALREAAPVILNVVTDATASETLAFYRRSGFVVAGYVKDEFLPGVIQAHLTLEVRR